MENQATTELNHTVVETDIIKNTKTIKSFLGCKTIELKLTSFDELTPTYLGRPEQILY